MLSIFLLSFRNTGESLGELEKALACRWARIPTGFFVLLFSRASTELSRNIVHVFCSFK